ncbi:Protein of unknown function, partial [Gryllus bimaculatus]
CPRSHCGPRVTAERAPNGEAARGEANEAAVGPDSCEAAVRCVAWRRVAARGGRGPQANAALRVVGGGCGAGVGQPRGQRVRLRRRLQAPQQRARLRGVPGGALPSAAVAARARARSHAHGAPGRPPAALPHRRARRTAALLR